MRNKYGGPCYRCGEYVKPGEGFFERGVNRRLDRLGFPKRHFLRNRDYICQHATCAEEHKGTNFSSIKDKNPYKERMTNETSLH